MPTLAYCAAQLSQFVMPNASDIWRSYPFLIPAGIITKTYMTDGASMCSQKNVTWRCFIQPHVKSSTPGLSFKDGA